MEERLDTLKYFKEGQTSTQRQWATDLGEKVLKIIGTSASRYIKASLEKRREERKRRKKKKEEEKENGENRKISDEEEERGSSEELP